MRTNKKKLRKAPTVKQIIASLESQFGGYEKKEILQPVKGKKIPTVAVSVAEIERMFLTLKAEEVS